MTDPSHFISGSNGLALTRPNASRGRVHHTLAACSRCRQRKTRCDAELPRCGPCERNDVRCVYFDATKNRMLSRNYITSLQDNVRRLQAELVSLENEAPYAPDPETMIRSAGLIKFSGNDESKFLGPSSGIAMTRLVMELAKRNCGNKSIRDLVPDTAAREIKKKFDDESAKPTSKVYPLISSVAAQDLPTHELMEKLVDIYMAKAQYLLPLLHEPTFRQEVQEVYNGSIDPTLNFQLRLVIAISMQRLDSQYAGLADSYYLAALPYLEAAIQKRDLSTLQCFALIAQYSVLTPTRTACYWVVGLGARLCQELGLCEEETIQEFPAGNRLGPLEVDMRRRLFWIISSMDFGLAHSLGRPSAFGMTVDHIDVRFFQLCDDRFITPHGLSQGQYPIMKKCISIHFLKMRLLQAEIRRMLYLKKRETPKNNEDPWFVNMRTRLDEWVSSCPKNDEGSGLSETWFLAKRNSIIITLYRPSPQIPVPSANAAQRCYDAAIFNLDVQKQQMEAHLVDLTWILTQTLFQSLNAVLWSISYPEIRQRHPIDEVSTHIRNALEAIDMAAVRWPGVQSARQLYEHLVQGCLKVYDNTSSNQPHPGIEGESPASVQDTASTPSRGLSYSPASTHPTSYVPSNSPSTITEESAIPTAADFATIQHPNANLAGSDHLIPGQFIPPSSNSFAAPVVPRPAPDDMPAYSTIDSGAPVVQPVYQLPDFQLQFDPGSSSKDGMPLQQHWDHNAMMTLNYAVDNDVNMDYRPWLSSFGEEYSRYTQQMYLPTLQQMQPLSQQQQSELMATLEQDQLPDVSGLVSDSATFYNPYYHV